ncbi:hypothetical protein F887_03164 [Acinetobacter sp. NIPH 2100]|nr:hypothetical protein F887_03164 [Acinetobacter sp. NIPH 2100]
MRIEDLKREVVIGHFPFLLSLRIAGLDDPN